MTSSAFISRLEDHFTKELAPEVIGDYVKALRHYNDAQRARIYDLLLETCRYMPKIADINQAAESIATDLDTLRPKKPEAPAPLVEGDPLERQAWARQIVESMKKSIAAGKHSFPAPSYTDYAAALARERLGGSTIPDDPEERARWARNKAKEQGWR